MIFGKERAQATIRYYALVHGVQVIQDLEYCVYCFLYGPGRRCMAITFEQAERLGYAGVNRKILRLKRYARHFNRVLASPNLCLSKGGR